MRGNSEEILELLARLEGQGVTLTPAPGGKLKVKGPANVVTPELLELISERKAEILEFLTTPTLECGSRTVRVYRARLECVEAGGCLRLANCELFYLTWAPGFCRERVSMTRPKNGARNGRR